MTPPCWAPSPAMTTRTRGQHTEGGGGGFNPSDGGSKTKHDITARVQLPTRVVSPDTAEVLSVAQRSGEIMRKGVQVDVRDSTAAGMMLTGNVDNPVMNEALGKATAAFDV